MRAVKTLIISLYFLIPFGSFGTPDPMLYLNEVSQGTQDGQEYVELVVVAGCPSPTVNTVDLRALILDDNNGVYQTGPGANISTGALRFADIPFWQAIPEGTFIVIYNEANRNPAIPPDDLSMTDGNNRLILPANSTLLEGQGGSPTPTNSNYYGPWITGGGLWSYVSMEDDGDTFKVQSSWSSGAFFNCVCWGTNTGTFQIPDQYFASSAAGRVFYVDMHVAQGGWISAPAGTAAETPGEPNSAHNSYWIYQPSAAGPLQFSLTSDPESCFNACDATVYAQPSGGVTPYHYVWNIPSQTSTVAHNLCPGTYWVEVTDTRGCHATDTIVIEAAEELLVSMSQTDETCPGECDGTAEVAVTGGTGTISITWSQGPSGTEVSDLCPGIYYATVEDSAGCVVEIGTTIDPAPPLPSSVFSAAGPFQEYDPPVQLQNSTPGGTYTTNDCSGCLTPDGMFDPSAAGIGTYEICYTLTAGSCSSVQCQSITVDPCVPVHTSETVYICEGDSTLIFGSWESQQDIFSHTFDGSRCDSTHQITLLYHDTPDTYASVSLCEDDSLFILGHWVDSSDVLSQEMESVYGCRYTNYITVTEAFCPDEDYVYIPNAFTPNGDQLNDDFRIELLGASLEEGYIYNRWGEVVTRFDESHLSWSGENPRGEPAPDGVYVYMIRYMAINGIWKERVGHVTLLR